MTMLNVFIANKGRERRRRKKKEKSRPTSSRQPCVLYAFFLNTKNRRVVRSERANAGEKCSTSRLSLNYTVCSFVLSYIFSLSPSFFFLYFTRKMELCYLFSLIILVIYDGGRHSIEIARRNK